MGHGSLAHFHGPFIFWTRKIPGLIMIYITPCFGSYCPLFMKIHRFIGVWSISLPIGLVRIYEFYIRTQGYSTFSRD